MHSLQRIKHLALDLDGTLYLGGRLFACTDPFLKQISSLGIGRTFFTNNSSVSTQGYVEKLKKLGIGAAANDIFSSTTATLTYLGDLDPAPQALYVLGTPALRQEFADGGFRLCGNTQQERQEEPDAVIVGFDSTLDYPRLCEAAYWITRGKRYLATNGDFVCPTDQPIVLPDCGSFCRLLAAATGREPDAVLGKPAPAMLGGVMRRHNLRPENIAVVGDRLYTDIAMAHAAGAMGILVLSGEATRTQAETGSVRPDLIVQDVGELSRLLAESRRSAQCQMA